MMFSESKQLINKGDHIRVWRGGYYHHGIYCGDNTVIHYGGGKGHCVIKRDALEEFALGNKIELATYSKSSPVEEILERAESRIGEDKYNVAFNNCEHFANWCKTGQAKSEQVEVVSYTMTQAIIYPLIFSTIGGLKQAYDHMIQEGFNPEHLPHDPLLLFQRFKKAYESKNIEEIADCLSESFQGDVYGRKKSDFINFMSYNLGRLGLGISPYLTIEVFNISSWSDQDFAAVINMKANLQFIGIPTPVTWDAGKLFCQVKPEGECRYWRVTRLEKFKG